MNESALIFSLCKSMAGKAEDILFICKNEEDAITYCNSAKFFAPNAKALYFPSWDTVPYDRVSPSKYILATRAKILSELAQRTEKVIIFTSASNLIQKLPPLSVFNERHLRISYDNKISLEKITSYLVNNGFSRTSTAMEAGEFAQRGEIFDIVISEDEGYRISFAWNEIQQIKSLDPLSQTSYGKVNEFSIHPSSELILSDETIEHFKGEFLKQFSVNHNQNPIYLAISEGRVTASCEHLLPLCYPSMESIIDYLKSPKIIYADMALPAVKEAEAEVKDFYEARLENNKLNPTQFYPLLSPERLYLISHPEFPAKPSAGYAVASISGSNDEIPDQVRDDNKATTPNFYSKSIEYQIPIADLVAEFVKTNPKQKLIIFCPALSGIEKIRQLLEIGNLKVNIISQLADAKNQINLVQLPLAQSFTADDICYLRQQEIIGEKRLAPKVSANKKLKDILNELETFELGDFVVHEEHGIAEFGGIETITVLGIRHDCIKLIYEGDDKLYIPVENLDVIKKYGNSDVPRDKLGGVSWQKRKSKLKNRIGDLAKKLIRIAAERKLISLDPTNTNEEYQKFAAKFPYTETDDQLTAIADIEKDLVSGYPMDRLICGDVGYGKTEVAMRAAFIVASSGKQVAIVAPTTILARQHYNNFIERFAGTKLKIAQLSRLTPASQISNIHQGLLDGSINIVIGTHALLAKNIKFNNLGMMIIDEEQHFGVAQKERLKELKHGTHVIALSATPIPRTLQMSMLGIRDLSLIATPPIDRLSVRTHVIPDDQIIIRDALMREHFRGGRSFYVCPRIKDIEDITKTLSSLVPELKYQIAHGQMPPTVIDKIMSEFYEGKFDILLCTTIIESGIDIPAANTIIIHRSDMLGLSQLYQLRGRVGRSKVRGYAYLIIQNSKTITKNSLKRLDIMQNIDSLGAGFTIASYDSDIRGFGNLVGEEQSGHIREVGAELYEEMLQQAIEEIEFTKPKGAVSPTLNISLPIYIPEEYVEDGEQRLALYKRISSLDSNESIEEFKDELIDRFGPIPESTLNLLYLVKIKQLCKKLHITDLDSGPNGIVLKFSKDHDVSIMVLEFTKKHPRNTKLRPDNKLFISLPTSSQLSSSGLTRGSKDYDALHHRNINSMDSRVKPEDESGRLLTDIYNMLSSMEVSK